MRRIGTLSIVGVLLITGIAVAASVHFKPRGPVFRDNGTTLNATGTLAGLGNEDLTITLQAEGTASTVGFNQGGNAAPGQNVGISATATTTISASEIQNGQLFISLTTPEPRQPTAAEAGLPNENWTAVITDVKFTKATITVVQGGEVVFKKSYTP